MDSRIEKQCRKCNHVWLCEPVMKADHCKDYVRRFERDFGHKPGKCYCGEKI